MARRRQFASSVPDGTAGDTSQESRYGESVGAVLALPDRAQHAAPLHFNSAAPAFTFFGPRGTKQSEVFTVRSLTFTENDVALPAERGNLEYAGLSLVYEGNRVKSALLGRDLNPLGRGDGIHYFAGGMTLAAGTRALNVWGKMVGTGNSVNNAGQTGGGYTPIGPPSDGSSSSPQLELISDWKQRTGKQPVYHYNSDGYTLQIGMWCCATLSACCMTTTASGDYLPYTRCFEGPELPDCGDPSDCGDAGGGGGNGGGSKGGGGGTSGNGGGCSGCGGGAGGGPMSWQGGGGGQFSWSGGGPQGAPPPPPPPGGGSAKPPQPGSGEDIAELNRRCHERVNSLWGRVDNALYDILSNSLSICACAALLPLLPCLFLVTRFRCVICASWIILGGEGWGFPPPCIWLRISDVLGEDDDEVVKAIVHEYAHNCGALHTPGWFDANWVDTCLNEIRNMKERHQPKRKTQDAR